MADARPPAAGRPGLELPRGRQDRLHVRLADQGHQLHLPLEGGDLLGREVVDEGLIAADPGDPVFRVEPFRVELHDTLRDRRRGVVAAQD